MITHWHSHVTASGAPHTSVRERMSCTIIIASSSLLKSLLKIKKLALFEHLIPFLFLLTVLSVHSARFPVTFCAGGIWLLRLARLLHRSTQLLFNVALLSTIV